MYNLTVLSRLEPRSVLLLALLSALLSGPPLGLHFHLESQSCLVQVSHFPLLPLPIPIFKKEGKSSFRAILLVWLQQKSTQHSSLENGYYAKHFRNFPHVVRHQVWYYIFSKNSFTEDTLDASLIHAFKLSLSKASARSISSSGTSPRSLRILIKTSN